MADARAGPVRLEAAIRSRVREDVGPPLADRHAHVLLDAGNDGAVTVLLFDGVVAVRPGRYGDPTTCIRGDLDSLVDIIEGRTSGVAAFLDRRVSVDGDLSLSLAMDGVFETGERPERFPRAGRSDVAKVRTFYLEAGPAGGMPVVGLHGLGATNASLLPTLWDLGADHHVVMPDLPGHGASSAPRGRYDAHFYARWLTAFLDERGLGRVVLLGNSLGGRIALEVAMLAPERVGGLVLLAPAVAFRKLRQLSPLVRLLRPEAAGLPIPMTRRMAEMMLRAMFSQPDRLTPQSFDAAAGEFVRVYRSRAHRIAFFRSLRSIYLDDAFGPHGFWHRVPDLEPPALFVWGARDRLVPAGFARHVVDAVPHATSVVLDDCGHVPQFELPDRTHALVRGFLHGLPGGRTTAASA